MRTWRKATLVRKHRRGDGGRRPKGRPGAPFNIETEVVPSAPGKTSAGSQRLSLGPGEESKL